MEKVKYTFADTSQDHFALSEYEYQNMVARLDDARRWSAAWKSAAKQNRREMLDVATRVASLEQYQGFERGELVTHRDTARHWARRMKAERDYLADRVLELQGCKAAEKLQEKTPGVGLLGPHVPEKHNHKGVDDLPTFRNIDDLNDWLDADAGKFEPWQGDDEE